MEKHRYHKLKAALCVLTLLLSLTACGGNASSSPQSADPAEPAPSETTQPETPMTLGQYVKSAGLHVVYVTKSTGIGKEEGLQYIFLFEDGKLAVAETDRKLGDLSRMTDEEIAAEVYASPDTELDCAYFLYVETDSTENRVEKEYIRFAVSTGQLFLSSVGLEPRAVAGVVYDSQYIGYQAGHAVLTRGEAFTLDGVGSEYAETDPSREELDALDQQYLPSAARYRLEDGTFLKPPEDGSHAIILPLTEGRTLGAEDVQYSKDDKNVSPLAPFHEVIEREYWDIVGWGEDSLVESDDIYLAPGGWMEILDYSTWLSYVVTNPGNENIPFSDAAIVSVQYGSDIAASAGPITTTDDLLAMYGDPVGMVVEWNDTFTKVYDVCYWKGDGFFLLNIGETGEPPIWEYAGVCDPELAVFTDLRLYTQIALLESVQ